MNQAESIMHLQRTPVKNRILIQSNQWGKGWLEHDYMAGTTIGRLKQSEYLFITKGRLKQETYIHDKYTKELVGLITFNSLRTRAKIRLNNNKVYSFKCVLPCLFRWEIVLNQQTLVTYNSSLLKGTVRSLTTDEVLVLAGLFARNAYLLYAILFAGTMIFLLGYWVI
ncbi:MAG: hypothetical protein R6U66_11095 [Bacteroidales bacterium]